MLPYVGYNYTTSNIYLEITNLHFIILIFPNLIFKKMELNYLYI